MRLQAYYIIQAAQAKEELKRAGDLLNEAIKKESRNLRVLATTRDDLKQRNTQYRLSFHRADPEGADARLKSELDDKRKKTLGMCRCR